MMFWQCFHRTKFFTASPDQGTRTISRQVGQECPTYVTQSLRSHAGIVQLSCGMDLRSVFDRDYGEAALLGIEKVFKQNAANLRDGVRVAMNFAVAGPDNFFARHIFAVSAAI